MSRETRSGIWYGIAAYGFWGVIAAYFKWIRIVAPLEILAHRIVWSFVFLAGALTLLRRWPDVLAIARRPAVLRHLAISTMLIGGNWYLFIWAVTNDHMLDSSLGYFMNPLLNVLLGLLFFRERLRSGEWVAVGLAAAGVAWITIASGVLPWISIVIATLFALYGLVRKIAHVNAIEGLTIETVMLLPFAAGYLFLLGERGELAFTNVSRGFDLLLIAAGPITALPLLWFAAAVRRLRLSTLGLLQYISPTIQFVMATTLFGEPLGHGKVGAFVLIWCAIGVYTVENFRHHTSARPAPPE